MGNVRGHKVEPTCQRFTAPQRCGLTQQGQKNALACVFGRVGNHPIRSTLPLFSSVAAEGGAEDVV